MAAIAGVIVSGFAHAAATGGWHMPASPALPFALAIGGLAQATLITTYDYWGYYNICFLGSEVRQPERTIPRAILLSVLFVSVFYVAMNLAALPSLRDAAAHAAESAAAPRAAGCRHRPLRLRPLGRIPDRRAHRLDRLRLRLLAAARLLARTVRRRA